MEYVSITTNGRVRREVVNGRSFLVAPMTIIVPGVLSGSEGSLYYSMQEIARNYKQWDGVPIVKHHPTANGRNVSVKHPGVLPQSGMGFLRNTSIANRLKTEGWFDEECTRRVDPGVHRALLAGDPVELSTGLYVDRVKASSGAHYNGRGFTHYAINYRADHLAILPDQRGACSVRDGCGVNVSNSGTRTMTAGVVCNQCGVVNCKATGKPGPCKGQKRGTRAMVPPTAPRPGPKASAEPATAEDASHKANAVTKMAQERTAAAAKRPSKYARVQSSVAHEMAAEHHLKASEHHAREGDKVSAKHHADTAAEHSKIAKEIDKHAPDRKMTPGAKKTPAPKREFKDTDAQKIAKEKAGGSQVKAPAAKRGPAGKKAKIKDAEAKAEDHLREAKAARESGDHEKARRHSVAATGMFAAAKHHDDGDHEKAEKYKALAADIASGKHKLPDRTMKPADKAPDKPTDKAPEKAPADKPRESSDDILKRARDEHLAKAGKKAPTAASPAKANPPGPSAHEPPTSFREGIRSGVKELGRDLTSPVRGVHRVMKFLKKKITGNDHTFLQENGPVFKNLAEATTHLTTNCDCFKGKPEALKGLDEKAVVEMANNHKIAQLARDGFTDDDLKTTYQFDADKMSFVGNTFEEPAGTQVANAGAGAAAKTADEWLKDAPPAIREAVVNAAKVANRERETLIGRLTANVSDAAVKATLTKSLQTKSMEDLELMAALAPSQQAAPAANTSYAHLFPPYAGAGGGPSGTTHVANAGGDLKGETLTPPRMTYEAAPANTAR